MAQCLARSQTFPQSSVNKLLQIAIAGTHTSASGCKISDCLDAYFHDKMTAKYTHDKHDVLCNVQEVQERKWIPPLIGSGEKLFVIHLLPMLQDGTNLGSLDKYAVPEPILDLSDYVERTKERRKDKITGQLIGYISYKLIESDGTQIPRYVSVIKSESGNYFLSNDLNPHHPKYLGKNFHHH
jgi:hypothetical protein